MVRDTICDSWSINYKVKEPDLPEFIKVEESKSVRSFCCIILFKVFTYSDPVFA